MSAKLWAAAFLIFVPIIAGVRIPILGQQPASTATPIIPYSESIPYKPRLFQISKKKSKDKKDKADEVVVHEQQPEQMPGNGPVVKEDSPVTIPVSVFDIRGNFVTGLKKEDFKMYIDGSEVTVLNVEQRKEPLNVLLVVDTSPSGTEVFDAAKKLALATVDQFGPDDKIKVFRFSSSLKELSPLTADRAVVGSALKKVKPGGDGTSLYDITRELFETHVAPLTGRTIVLLITDGVDTTSSTKYSVSLVAAEMTEATVYPIYLDTYSSVRRGRTIITRGLPPELQAAVQSALGNYPPPKGTLESEYQVGRLYLNDLIYLSGGRAIDVTDLIKGTPKVPVTISDELRQQYYVTFSPVGTAYVGQRKHLKVRVNRPNLAVTARGSYVVGSPPSKVALQ
ncbi:MAG TPA: VWA domain-containing protein [Pyrinomonadaceae bacterium]